MDFNNFKLAGYLVRKDVVMGKNKDTKMPWLMLTLTIDVGNGNRVDLSMFANEKKKDGNDNSIYKGLMTIKDEFKSLKSTVKNKRLKDDAEAVDDESTTVAELEECDFVRCNKGVTLQMNRYMRDGQMNENFRLSANFVNRVTDGDKTPFIEGTLSGVVESKGMVTEGGVDYPTMVLVVPTYREAWGDNPERVVVEKFPLILRMEDEDAISYFDSEFDANMPVSLGVEPTTMVIVEEKEDPTQKRGFGKVPTFNQTKVVRELRIIGGYPLAESEYESEKAFDVDLYNEGLQEFDRKIEELKADSGKDTTIAPKGFGRPSLGKTSSSDMPF